MVLHPENKDAALDPRFTDDQNFLFPHFFFFFVSRTKCKLLMADSGYCSSQIWGSLLKRLGSFLSLLVRKNHVTPFDQ